MSEEAKKTIRIVITEGRGRVGKLHGRPADGATAACGRLRGRLMESALARRGRDHACRGTRGCHVVAASC